ncbi:MAG: serine/threonine-protein kinase [Sulfitobacter sp.]
MSEDKKDISAKSEAAPDADEDEKTRFQARPAAQSGPEEPPADGAAKPSLARNTEPDAEEKSGSPSADVPPLPMPTSRDASAISGGTTAMGIGTTINNNYRIEEVLKSGGMGSVYRGVEIGTGDPVAIKAILPELAEDEKAGQMFKREARTLRRLAHEAIVQYYNYVHDRDLDQYFLVMEYIEGVPLADHLAQHGPLPVPEVWTLLKRLSAGLNKAHSQTVVHRDLSPDNVMLPGGDVEQARLIDFGIAKSNVVTEGTMHGQFAGKFKYVAPEQLGHFGGEIGPAADIYGLALLTAAASLGEPLAMGTSIVDAVTSRQQIPDLSHVPEALRPILSIMLEPDPADRPASMDEVRRMIDNPHMIPEQYRRGMPVVPQATIPPSPHTAPPGLQMPGAAFAQTTMGHAKSVAPQPLPQHVVEEPEPSSGKRALAVLLGSFAVICAALGYAAWEFGMLDEAEPAFRPALEMSETREGIPPPQNNTRAGFLADFDAGACTYTTRVAIGQRAGMIEAFSATGGSFPGLPVAYEEQFGARPAVFARQVTDAQCAALDFARALQGRGREAPVLGMSADEIASGEAVTMRIGDVGAQSLWAALITPGGAVYNLTNRLSDPVGGRRSLSFGLNLAEGSSALPQLVVLVASDRPLAQTATATEGELVSTLLPEVLDEIAARGGAASVSLGYVLLQPKPVEGDGQERDL